MLKDLQLRNDRPFLASVRFSGAVSGKRSIICEGRRDFHFRIKGFWMETCRFPGGRRSLTLC